jgi:formylglycine-generating enzyme
MRNLKTSVVFFIALMSAFATLSAEPSAAPKMKAIPAGKLKTFTCPAGQVICPEHEFVELTVDVAAFEIAETETTFAQWDQCVQDGACIEEPSEWVYKNRPVYPPCVEEKPCQYPFDENWGRAQRPVVNVSWHDVQKYLKWLNAKTGGNYRLPSSQEWEYAALAGSSNKNPWGQKLGKNNANCDGCGSPWDNKQTAPVASFKPNAWGLHDLVGNVSEWVSNCFPTREKNNQTCMTYVYRGGAWSHSKRAINPRLYGSSQGELRASFLGFRVARTPRHTDDI